MRVFGFTGLSGSGKTTLLAEVIAYLRVDGLTVSAIKHAHHGFDLDRPGKDSYRMREAGCEQVLLVGDQRSVLMTEFRDAGEPALDDLLASLRAVDLVLIEGFRGSQIPKIEVHRPSLGKPPVWPCNPTVIAVATDESIVCDRPLLDLSDPALIAAFVQTHAASRQGAVDAAC